MNNIVYKTHSIEEKITIDNNKALCHPLYEGEDFEVSVTQPVSMNLFAFKKDFIKRDLIKKDFMFFHPDFYTFTVSYGLRGV